MQDVSIQLFEQPSGGYIPQSVQERISLAAGHLYAARQGFGGPAEQIKQGQDEAREAAKILQPWLGERVSLSMALGVVAQMIDQHAQLIHERASHVPS